MLVLLLLLPEWPAPLRTRDTYSLDPIFLALV